MKLTVTPIYGWGWFTKDRTFEVPPPFDLEVDITEAGKPFISVLGLCAQSQHPLHGFWILLSGRHKPFDGACNLMAFRSKPTVPKITEPLSDKPEISGYADVTIVAKD